MKTNLLTQQECVLACPVNADRQYDVQSCQQYPNYLSNVSRKPRDQSVAKSRG